MFLIIINSNCIGIEKRHSYIRLNKRIQYLFLIIEFAMDMMMTLCYEHMSFFPNVELQEKLVITQSISAKIAGCLRSNLSLEDSNSCLCRDSLA